MTEVVTAVWEVEEMPSKWKKGLICQFCTKEEKMDCRNFRGATLFSIAYEIPSKVLDLRFFIPCFDIKPGKRQQINRRSDLHTKTNYEQMQVFNVVSHHFCLPTVTYRAMTCTKQWRHAVYQVSWLGE
jgi:hypothetical protein